MALTRDFKETVIQRVQGGPTFAQAARVGCKVELASTLLP